MDPLEDRPENALTESDKTNGMLCHLLALAGYVIPFGHVIGPLVIWMMKKDESTYVDAQGREALNFQISMTIWYVIAGLLCLVLIGFLILPVLGIAALVLTIIGGIKANSGEEWQYPLTIRFL